MEDRFASIVCQCEHSESQEQRLCCCGFYRESQQHQQSFSGDESSPSDDFPVASTGILIMSLPSSSTPERSSKQDDEFQTPEEQLVTSSDELNRNPNEHVDSGKNDASGGVDGTVVLGRDTDLVCSDDRSLAEEEEMRLLQIDVHVDVSCGGRVDGENREDEEVSVVEEWKGSEFADEKVPLVKDLGFSETKGGGLSRACDDDDDDTMMTEKVFDSNDVVVIGIDDCVVEEKVDEPGESSLEKNEGNLCDSVVKSSVNLRMNAVQGQNGDDSAEDSRIVPPVISMTERLESVSTDSGEAPESSSKKTCNVYSEAKALVNEMGHEMNSEKASGFDDPPLPNDKGENSRSNFASELEKVEYIKSGDPTPGVLELGKMPDWVDRIAGNATGGGEPQGPKRKTRGEVKGSVKGGGKNGEEEGLRWNEGRRAIEALRTVNPPKHSSNILDAMKISSRRIDQNKGDIDILDVVKQSGMKVPRPRWWRPEGY